MPPRRTAGRAINRRQFIQAAALSTATAAPNAAVSIVADPADPVAGTGPAQWALKELEDALAARGIATGRYDRVAAAPPGGPCIVAAKDPVPAPEGLRIAPATLHGRSVLLA